MLKLAVAECIMAVMDQTVSADQHSGLVIDWKTGSCFCHLPFILLSRMPRALWLMAWATWRSRELRSLSSCDWFCLCTREKKDSDVASPSTFGDDESRCPNWLMLFEKLFRNSGMVKWPHYTLHNVRSRNAILFAICPPCESLLTFAQWFIILLSQLRNLFWHERNTGKTCRPRRTNISTLRNQKR
jgi:hypothetical protein